jgi:hypothetical protein
MMNIEQISIDLVNKLDEIHAIQAALNNLELVKKAQDAQDAAGHSEQPGWGNYTGKFIRHLKLRTIGLQKKVFILQEQLEELRKKEKQEINDQISMSMGYL